MSADMLGAHIYYIIVAGTLAARAHICQLKHFQCAYIIWLRLARLQRGCIMSADMLERTYII